MIDIESKPQITHDETQECIQLNTIYRWTLLTDSGYNYEQKAKPSQIQIRRSTQCHRT